MNSFPSGMNSFRTLSPQFSIISIWNEFIPDRNEFIPHKTLKVTILPFSFLLQLPLRNWKLCFLILSLHKKFYFLALFVTPNSSIYPEWFHSGSEWIHSDPEMNSFQIEIMENCGDKVRNEFIPDRNEFIPVNFFHSATMNCARQKRQWMDRTSAALSPCRCC